MKPCNLHLVMDPFGCHGPQVHSPYQKPLNPQYLSHTANFPHINLHLQDSVLVKKSTALPQYAHSDPCNTVFFNLFFEAEPFARILIAHGT